MKTDLPQSIRIKDKRKEADNMFVFTFDYSVGAAPGQFVMVWEGEIDELPISVMEDDGKRLQLLIGAVGDGSKVICAKEKGDYLGIRGAYGSSFDVPKGTARVAMVAGGYGVAPLYFLSKRINDVSPATHIDFILGARTKNMLLLTKEIEKLEATLRVATDDGSEGVRGYTTNVLDAFLEKEKYDHIYTVGPEIMMKKVADACIAREIACHVSIERFMKCGIGVCGACCVDETGERMCVEGPVYNAEHLERVPEFGSYHRNAASQRVYF